MQYTEALATAIHQLKGKPREDARDALAERLTRMTAATLRDRFTDEDRELRSAAALAAAMKEDKSFVLDLITLFRDPDSRVRRAAVVGLKSLTGQDFGPDNSARPADYRAAAARWHAWWRKQQRP